MLIRIAMFFFLIIAHGDKGHFQYCYVNFGYCAPQHLEVRGRFGFFELYFQVLIKVQFYKGKLNIYEKVERQQYTT